MWRTDTVAGVVRVRAEAAKIGIARTLPISTQTSNALADFLGNRPLEWPKTMPVFTSAYGRTLDKDTWGDILEAYGKRLSYHLFPYALRHTFAIQFLRRGGNAFALQALMGHTSMEMTRLYVHLAETDVEAAHKLAKTIEDLIEAAGDTGCYVFDFFAGSGTTAHAVINLNRDDGGRRKYILAEMADYFHTVLRPRIKKVVFSDKWKDARHSLTAKESATS